MPAVPASLPANENERLDALKRYDILDTPAEQDFDDLARIAAYICNVPISLVSLIDDSRQWFKARVGLDALETPRELAFCAHAILQDDLFVVPNALEDMRFATNPLVTSAPDIRFYAGAPLITSDNLKLGTLCVIDRVPRQLTAAQHEALQALARQVIAQMELRHTVSKLSQANDQLAELATTDSLTGLNNVRAFRERLKHEIERSSRTMEPLSLIMMDIDHFKKYNDTHGHPEGDALLQTMGKLLREAVRAVDFVSRCGGEEFVILLPNTHVHRSYEVAERIRFQIEMFPWPLQQVTASFGVATLNHEASTESLIEGADKALYHSKNSGRNRVTHTAYSSNVPVQTG